MKNLVLNPHNVYEEKSKEFLNSKLADRLREKYRVKPFEEEYKPLYYVALIISYLCNGFSILTASTYVFKRRRFSWSSYSGSVNIFPIYLFSGVLRL